MTHEVFISYSIEDKKAADATCNILESNNIPCWIAPRDSLPSVPYAESVIDAINNCRLLVLIFSANSNKSPQVLREVNQAVKKAVPILPFRIEDVEPTKAMEYYLSTPHWLDALTPSMETHLNKLLEVVKLRIAPLDNYLSADNRPANLDYSRKILLISITIFLLFSGVCFLLFLLLQKEKTTAVAPVFDGSYVIDYESGSIPLEDLEIGARVIDLTWEWEHRTGCCYGFVEGNLTKPVDWIIVSKDHYGADSGVTLLSEDTLGHFRFDNSTDRGSDYGNNCWRLSGIPDATSGLRPWLNSQGIHKNEGFYNSFSQSFKNSLVYVTIDSRLWEDGFLFPTRDIVFIPSTTELGDTEHKHTYVIGSAYQYFSGPEAASRRSKSNYYWTRSPSIHYSDNVYTVDTMGSFRIAYYSISCNIAVRPALNLKSDTMVSEMSK